MDGLIPLHALHAGDLASVALVVGDPHDVHQLHEFGLRQGVPVEMFRAGNPCIIRLAGNKVCLRADRQLRVLVRPCTPD